MKQHQNVPRWESIKVNLTEEVIRKLLVPAGALDVQIFDDKLPGFGVRKQASGHAAYFVKFSVGKQQRRKTLGRVVAGNLQAMRLEASAIRAKAHLDVVAEAQKAQKAEQLKTFGELVPAYLEVREKGDEFWAKLRPKSLVDVTRYLTKSWRPLHGEPVDKITRQQIKNRRDEIVSESGAISANRAHTALSTFFAWAIDREHLVGANPTADIKALKQNKRKRGSV